ncbi:MAG: hypothetical protein PF638_15775 [Candidatus Delongbacteria bacterium]|jgi:hypothetical protein|nr:hypothetical protein [Candidatus Delongbacteria bacterium]
MWKKIKDLKYLIFARYLFSGLIISVIVYYFLTQSIRNQGLDLNLILEKEVLKDIIKTAISGLVGVLFGSIVYLAITINKKDRHDRDLALWTNLKGKNSLFIRNIIAFSIGGFVYKVLGNIFEMNSYDNFFQSLFSKDLVIEYIGFIIASTLFSIFMSFGIKKRLRSLFSDHNVK